MSGKKRVVMVRMTEALKKQLDDASARWGQSMNAICVGAIQRSLDTCYGCGPDELPVSEKPADGLGSDKGGV